MYWLWLVGLCHIDGKSLAHVRSGVVFRFLEVHGRVSVVIDVL